MMKRLTVKSCAEATVPESEWPEALRRLAAFEDIYGELADSLTAIPAALEKLKEKKKKKTVRCRELFGQKLVNNQLKDLFERHGIAF
jgi:molecular chaperone GrpE (heat shock protein)